MTQTASRRVFQHVLRPVGLDVKNRSDREVMKEVKDASLHLVRHAHLLAREVGAKAILVYWDTVRGDDELRQLLETLNFDTILITRSSEAFPRPVREGCTWVTVPDVHMTRMGQVKMALLSSLAKGVLETGDRVVCLTGIDGSSAIDTVMVLNLGTEPELFSTSGGFALTPGVRFDVFERTLSLATQLAVEGREGRPVGLIFVLGDSDNVLAQSTNMILNPFRGYPESERNILDPTLGETVKEFSALDGAFVIRGDGVLLTAGAHLTPNTQSAPLPKGLGTRHAAAAAITASAEAVAIVVSQSTGTVAVFKSGKMVTDIHKPNVGTHRVM